MTAKRVEDIYEQHIKSLPDVEQLRLIALIAKKLIETVETATHSQRSLLELEGLGAEIWQGIDAQQYVDELRKEWDHRP
ncbi:MAG: hypothetical protein KatS3mg131_3379 [Candidatus Tectimicrobiota bacterium]|nr:MAG: hypothetical protein KatS3mg131_3379 [Candidatus Tectomicrobia bacterium]